jgi:septum formation protein
MNSDLFDAALIWRMAGLSEPLILASSSPRRSALLEAIGCPFEAVRPAEDDDEYENWDGGEHLRRCAVQKAESVERDYPRRVIIAADTVVKSGNRIFGKPKDEQHAEFMLKSLSGRTHTVLTALHVISPDRLRKRTEITRTSVYFKSLTNEEIRAYIASGEPLDKAGAYGIQGLGGLWVERIEGCFYNVVGLPLFSFWNLLRYTGGDY